MITAMYPLVQLRELLFKLPPVKGWLLHLYKVAQKILSELSESV